MLGIASALWPREGGGAKGAQASTSVSGAGGGQSRSRREVSKETPGFLSPTLTKADSLSEAGTRAEGSGRS